MEDNIQTIIIVIISAFLLFIFPVYMAYEKKDDISYVLAMRYTQDLVDEVRSKGYITKYMYEDYRAKLKVTGNSYDIQLTHEHNRYDPITNYYTLKEDGLYELVKTTTQEQRKVRDNEIYEQAIYLGKLTSNSTKQEIDKYIAKVYKDNENIDKIEDTFSLSKEVYGTSHIENVLNGKKLLLLNATSEKVVCGDNNDENNVCQQAYIMNAEDNFNVIIKNTNTTLATVMYNMVTANVLDKNTRIYVNYGGSILSTKWYGNIDYSKLKHDTLSLDEFEEIFKLDNELYFSLNNYPIEKIDKSYEGQYILEFDTKPTEVIELKSKGDILTADYSEYNFAIGHDAETNTQNMMSVSVGLNGISLIGNVTTRLYTSTSMYNLEMYDTGLIDPDTGLAHQEQRKITDYVYLKIQYESKGKLSILLIGKDLRDTVKEIIEVKDDEDLLNGFVYINTNPQVGIYTGDISQATNARGTKARYRVYIAENHINIAATKTVSNEATLLSYPVTIDDYVSVRIEMALDEELGQYVALLYLDGERVAKSIGLGTDKSKLPRVNLVGGTNIGTEARYFRGWIKNVKLYN